MAQPLTYQQILAEQYEESARDRLVFQSAGYEDEEVEPQFGPHIKKTQDILYEIEDRHAYKEFAGNRHLEDDVIKTKEFEDKSKLSVRYNKDVKLNVFNIDSRFRAYATPGTTSAKAPTSDPTYDSKVLSATSSPSHFIFRTSKQTKNAISIKLTSFEMPNIFWNFLASRGNTSFLIRKNGTTTWYKVTIPDGYYQTIDQLATAVQNALKGLTSVQDYDKFTCYAQDGFCYIGNSTSTAYDFDFTTSPFTYNSSSTGTVVQTQLFETLGDMLGFDVTNTYTNITMNSTALFGSYGLDVNPDHYIYLKINDYSTVTPQSINDTYYSVFSKIPITITKGLMIIDNDSTNSTTREYRFLQPTNIQQLEIQLLDMTGTEIVLRGNFSMTLEIEEVVSHSLYEKLREL
jgi:hypothetical protein